jgi:hypothetical protein
MTAISTPTPTPTSRPTPSATRTYPGAISAALLWTFALSAFYTVYTTITGVAPDSFNAWNPGAWLFYVVGFGAAVLARRDRPWVRWVLSAVLMALIAVCIFVYPSTFTPPQQTWFGWFENDVYTGLLILALYLNVQQIRRVALAPPESPGTPSPSHFG